MKYRIVFSCQIKLKKRYKKAKGQLLTIFSIRMRLSIAVFLVILMVNNALAFVNHSMHVADFMLTRCNVGPEVNFPGEFSGDTTEINVTITPMRFIGIIDVSETFTIAVNYTVNHLIFAVFLFSRLSPKKWDLIFANSKFANGHQLIISVSTHKTTSYCFHGLQTTQQVTDERNYTALLAIKAQLAVAVNSAQHFSGTHASTNNYVTPAEFSSLHTPKICRCRPIKPTIFFRILSVK